MKKWYEVLVVWEDDFMIDGILAESTTEARNHAVWNWSDASHIKILGEGR